MKHTGSAAMLLLGTSCALPLCAGAQATLRGRVERAGDREPVGGAEVSLPALERRALTDSSGAFSIDSLPAGLQIVQVRRVGFAVVRDTVTLFEGVVAARTFALASQAATLDPVRTLADRVRYISPGLRGFEDRRAAAASGYFIAEAELRKSDDNALTAILLSRTSGLAMFQQRGSHYLASSRKVCSGLVFLQKGDKCQACFVTVYVEGQLAYMADPSRPDAEPYDFNRVSVSELAGVEFYPASGTGPPGFNVTSAGCGTLLLWTRER